MSAEVMPFPLRAAGRVLAEAMDAANTAAAAEVAQRASILHGPGGSWCGPGDLAMVEEHARAAAVAASAPILHGLTADDRMVSIVAFGMAEEAVVRLRKAGLLR